MPAALPLATMVVMARSIAARVSTSCASRSGFSSDHAPGGSFHIPPWPNRSGLTAGSSPSSARPAELAMAEEHLILIGTRGNNPLKFSPHVDAALTHLLGAPLRGFIGPRDAVHDAFADLRAVEQWLALNANMLHATIQSLEVQRNTLSSIKAMGEALSQSMQQKPAEEKPTETTRPAAEALPVTWRRPLVCGTKRR